MGSSIRIRKARPGDAAAIARLYYETVHAINARHYTPAQIAAWAPTVYPDAYWRRRFRRMEVYVAQAGNAVVGFAELKAAGEIDCFYVHHAHQGEGVGSALLRRLEREARKRGMACLAADVSITAAPFFARRGFAVLRRQTRIYRRQRFRQFRMRKTVGTRRGGHGSTAVRI